MIYLFGNSVAYKTNQKGSSMFPLHLDNVWIGPRCEFIFEILWAVHQLDLKPKDIVILCIGSNDCIYRKDKKVQFEFAENLSCIAKRRKDRFAEKKYKSVMSFALQKNEDELFQYMSFEGFRKILDEILKYIYKMKAVAIVLSLPHMRETCVYYKETLETTKILEEETKKYNAYYADIWSGSDFEEWCGHKDITEITWDDTHLTPLGHYYAAHKINGGLPL